MRTSIPPRLSLGLLVIVSVFNTGMVSAATANYTYDNLNRLTSATIDGSRIEYVYDAAGNITRVLTPYSIAVTISGTGTGTVTDNVAKIDCGDDCSGAYDSGAVVTLTAIPGLGMTFAGWSGTCSGTGSCARRTSELRSSARLLISRLPRVTA